MERFVGTLVHGGKVPYTTWTFLVVPPAVVRSWGGSGPFAVRGMLAGVPFRGTVSRGEGVYRMPVVKELAAAAGVAAGDAVEVAIELDPEPRPVDVPPELRAVLDAHPDVAAAFDALAPSMRRAWAEHVAGAKRPETRARRAAAAVEGVPAKSWPR